MDIVERLRNPYDYYEPHDSLKTEAADEIERLRKTLEYIKRITDDSEMCRDINQIAIAALKDKNDE